MKVYQGGFGGRHRLCVAAKSWAAAHRKVSAVSPNTSLHHMRGYWSITGNDKQWKAAMSEPGTVFFSYGDTHQYTPVRSLNELSAAERSHRA